MRHQGREEIFIRVGSTSRLATREQQMRLFEIGGMLHTEVMPVPRTDISSLDEARLLNYLRDILRDPDIPETQEQWQQRLLGLSFLTQAGENVCCTIAGLVLFGKHPRQYLRQSGIRVFAFASEDKEYQPLLDDILDGPMVGRFDTEEAGKALSDGGLIERLMSTIMPFITSEAPLPDTHLRRETTWYYPLEAIRETVVNALAHRDWTRFVEIEIGLYSNRFEVISPGGTE